MRGDKYQYKEKITVSTVTINLRDQHTQEMQVLFETTSLPLSHCNFKTKQQQQRKKKIASSAESLLLLQDLRLFFFFMAR